MVIMTPQDPRFPLLHAKTQLVQFPLSQEDKDQIESMTKELTSLGDEAVGLSANQVGIPKNIFLIKDKNKIRVFINAKIMGFSSKKQSNIEGCLSLPGIVIKTRRPYSVTIEFFDQQGIKHLETMESKLGQIVSHELEHCSGQLIVKHFNSAKQKEVKRSKFGMKLTPQKRKEILVRRAKKK